MANNPTISQVAKINIDSNKNKSIDYYDLACEARNIKHFIGKAIMATGAATGAGVVTHAPYDNEDETYKYKIDPADISSSKQVTFQFFNSSEREELKKKYALFFFNLHCSAAINNTLPLYFFMLNNDNLNHTLVLEVPMMSIGNDKPIQLTISYTLNKNSLTLELTGVYDDNSSPTKLYNYTFSNMRLTYNIF